MRLGRSNAVSGRPPCVVSRRAPSREPACKPHEPRSGGCHAGWSEPRAGTRRSRGREKASRGGEAPCAANGWLGDDAEDVPLREDEKVLSVDDDFGPSVLGVDDPVALLDIEGHALAIVEPAWADAEDDALLGLLLRGVRDHETRGQRLVAVVGADEHPVAEWSQLHRT